MKLHYGCGTILKKNWTNVDAFVPDCVRFALPERISDKLWGYLPQDVMPTLMNETSHQDVTVFMRLDSPTDLSCVQASVVEELYSSHVLEHFHPAHVYELIGEFLRVLEPGGKMHHVVPDFDALVKMWKKMNHQYEGCGMGQEGKIFDMERYQTIVNGILCPWLFGKDYPPHKGLWNKNYASFLLRRWGFIHVEIETVDTDLHIKARAPSGSSNTIK
jgi:hypothetical protein